MSLVSQLTLRTVSGRTAVLTAPFTRDRLLQVATVELDLARDTVAVMKRRPSQRQRGRGGALTRLAPADHGSWPFVKAAPPTDEAVDLASLCGYKVAPDGTATLAVYGVPRKVAEAAKLHGQKWLPRRKRASSADRTGAGKNRGASHALSQAKLPDPPLIEVTADKTSVKARILPDLSEPVGAVVVPGPLPYPICPRGLDLIYAAILSPHALIGSELAATPNLLLRHNPLMQFIADAARSDAASGDADKLRAVMEQISVAHPHLFAWIQRYPSYFLMNIKERQMVEGHMQVKCLIPPSGVANNSTLDRHEGMGSTSSEAHGGNANGVDASDHPFEVFVWVPINTDTMGGALVRTIDRTLTILALLEEEDEDESTDNSVSASEENSSSATTTDMLRPDPGVEVRGPGRFAQQVQPRPLSSSSSSSWPSPPREPSYWPLERVGPFTPSTPPRSQAKAPHPPSQPRSHAPAPRSLAAVVAAPPSLRTASADTGGGAQARTSIPGDGEEEEEEVRMPPCKPCGDRAKRASSLVERGRRLSESFARARAAAPQPRPPLAPTSSIAASAAPVQRAEQLCSVAHSDWPVHDMMEMLRHHFQATMETVLQYRETGALSDARRAHDNIRATAGFFMTFALTLTMKQLCEDVLIHSWEFFVFASGFYLSLQSAGVRRTVFGTGETDSLAAHAFKMAVCRSVVTEAHRAMLNTLLSPQDGACDEDSICDTTDTTPSLRDWMRANAPPYWSPLMNPVTRWLCADGDEALLLELLQTLASEPHSCLVWYSHGIPPFCITDVPVEEAEYACRDDDPPTVFILRGRNADLVGEVAAVCLPSYPELAIEPWQRGTPPTPTVADITSRYDRLVRPLLDHLPLDPQSPLYVVNTLRVSAERVRRDPTAMELREAQLFPCYYDSIADEFAIDKWSIVTAAHPWDVQLAHEVPLRHRSVEEGNTVQLLCLTDTLTEADIATPTMTPSVAGSGANAAASLPSSRYARQLAAVEEMREFLPSSYKVCVDRLVSPDIGPQHVCILQDMRSSHQGGIRLTTMRQQVLDTSSGHRSTVPTHPLGALPPTLTADLLLTVWDDEFDGMYNPLSASGHRAIVLSTLSPSQESVFHQTLYERLAACPGMPLATAVRAAVLQTMRLTRNYKDALAVQLLNYGGPLPSHSVNPVVQQPAFMARTDRSVCLPPLPPLPPRPQNEREPRQDGTTCRQSQGIDTLCGMMMDGPGGAAAERPVSEGDIVDTLLTFVQGSEARMRTTTTTATREAACVYPRPHPPPAHQRNASRPMPLAPHPPPPPPPASETAATPDGPQGPPSSSSGPGGRPKWRNGKRQD